MDCHICQSTFINLLNQGESIRDQELFGEVTRKNDVIGGSLMRGRFVIGGLSVKRTRNVLGGPILAPLHLSLNRPRSKQTQK